VAVAALLVASVQQVDLKARSTRTSKLACVVAALASRAAH
jgi:hypothetical protein